MNKDIYVKLGVILGFFIFSLTFSFSVLHYQFPEKLAENIFVSILLSFVFITGIIYSY